MCRKQFKLIISSSMPPFITVLTPAYNKGDTIGRTFKSLLNQTCFDFEWLVINDGSADNTDDIVKGFKTEKFPIRYVSKKNEGLGRTFNEGVRLSKGKLIFRLDPDDYLSPNAIEQVVKYRSLLNDDNICALVFLAKFDTGEVVGYHPYKEEFHRSDFLKYRLFDKATGDRAEVVKTKVLKEFPWPTFENEKFCLETLLWHPIAHKYDAFYINEATYIREYNQNSITAAGSKTYITNPIGTMAVTSYLVKELIEYGGFRKFGYAILKNAINYWRYGLNAGAYRMCKSFKLPTSLNIIAFLPGWFLYKIDKKNPAKINKIMKRVKQFRNKDNFSNLTIKE